MFTLCSLTSKEMIQMAREAREPINVNGVDDWEASVDQVLAICDGDPRAALRTLLIANEYLHTEVDRLEAMISKGYARKAGERRDANG
jgi:hypothetical protein